MYCTVYIYSIFGDNCFTLFECLMQHKGMDDFLEVIIIFPVIIYNFLRRRTSANCYWSHTLPDVRSRGAISQHLKAKHLAVLDSETVA